MPLQGTWIGTKSDHLAMNSHLGTVTAANEKSAIAARSSSTSRSPGETGFE
jgi:hypothetical protein